MSRMIDDMSSNPDTNVLTDRASWVLPGAGEADFEEKPAWKKYLKWAIIAVVVIAFIWVGIDLYVNPVP